MMKMVYLMKGLNSCFLDAGYDVSSTERIDMRYEFESSTLGHINTIFIFTIFKVITHRLGHLIKDGKYMD